MTRIKIFRIFFMTMLFLLLGLGTTAFASDLPRIAVYVTGDVPENEKTVLGTRMLAALIGSGRYMGIERTDAFLSKIEEEHVKQRSGAIDDSQISELGRQFGVQYVCVADITPAFGKFQVSARIINVETAVVAFIGETFSPLRIPRDFTQASDRVVKKMFPRETKPQNRLSIGAGGFFTSDFAGGITWPSTGEVIAMPYYGGGAYIFFDAVYAEFFAGFSAGGGKWQSNSASNPNLLPDMPRTVINFDMLGKYPIAIGTAEKMKLFPLIGIGYETALIAKLISNDGKEAVDEQGNRFLSTNDLSVLRFKFGAGFDYNLNKNMYIRTSLLYGLRTANAFEEDIAKTDGVETKGGHGVTFKTGMGIRF